MTKKTKPSAPRTSKKPLAPVADAAMPKPELAEEVSGGFDRSRAPEGDLIAMAGGDDIGAAAMTRRIADNIRRIRKEQGKSLDVVSAASGVSRAALSQIEGAKTNPTLAVLWKVAVGLDVPFQSLLGGERAGRASLLRASDAPPLRTADGRIESRLLTPAGSVQGIEVYELRFLPRGRLASDAHSAGTSEIVLQLTGAMRVSMPEESYDLGPGDTLYFRADVAHVYENRSTGESRCLDIIAYTRH